MSTEKQEKFTKDFHFASEEDEVMGIETACYINGNQVKRIKLPDERMAVIRELNALELSNIDNMITPKTQGDYIFYQLHFSVKIDGNQLPMEEWKKVSGKVFNRVKVPMYQLNF